MVAWNRAELLAKMLDRLARQTRALDGVVVVDNASTDSTPTVIANAKVVTETITMPENLGGAGGFAAGIARAISIGADYVWIMDDDTLPHLNTLETLLTQWQKLAALPAVKTAKNSELGLLACRADWIDGREHPMNKPRLMPFAPADLVIQAKDLHAYPIRTASFVGPLISASAIREIGLPVADYFLWNDDFEYTARILRKRIGFYVNSARVEHRTKTFGNAAASPGKRFFNEVRNKFWMYRFSTSLTPFEKILYGGKTVLRWIKLLAADQNRSELLKYFAQGVKAGLRRPRTNTKIFESTPALADVLTLERESWEQQKFAERSTKRERSTK
ncbi:glycosyltransferase [Arcanobacterium hippocoleae]